jgi:ribose/xylose/arabinose/galactoside ABC-type transport system permease subunit
VNRVIFTAFTLSGFLSGFAGILLVGRLMMAEVWGGEPYLFLSFAASVLGGVSLFGGIGSLVGTLGGVITIGAIDSGLDLLAVSPFFIALFRGLIILIAVVVDTIKRRFI